MKTGRPRCAPENARLRAPGQRRPTRTSTTRPPGMLSTGGRRLARAERHGASAQYLPETVQYLLLDLRPLRLLAARRVLRLRVVSDGQRRLAALLLRPVGELSRVTGGRGSARTRGPGRRIIMGVGAFQPALWFWIPGRTWGPAWVSWAYAPGYVSWCPLGWDNRAAIGFGHAGYYGGRYDPWHAWTVVPHQRFGYGYVNSSYIGGTRIDARTRGAFVVRDTSPAFRGPAVPRQAAPIYAAGTRRAVPARVPVRRVPVTAASRVRAGPTRDLARRSAAARRRRLAPARQTMPPQCSGVVGRLRRPRASAIRQPHEHRVSRPT